MDTLHVARLNARYRLPAGDADVRARLDRVLRGVLDDALEQALARAGIQAHEEVCIRRVHAPARLRLAQGDGELAAAWSVALADGIRATLDAGGPGVVRYGSRSHALVDLLLGVAAGDLRRAWAWRQLGLWSASDSPPSALAAEEAARVLASRPESIVATLAEAARAGALPALTARIEPAAWRALTRAALFAASVADSVAEALLTSPAPARLPASSTAVSVDGTIAGAAPAVESPDTHTAEAERIVRGSRIAGSVVSDDGIASHPHVRRALAILAVLEAEPAALDRRAAASLVASVEREMGGDGGSRAHHETAADREMERAREAIDRTPSIDRDRIAQTARRASDRAAVDGLANETGDTGASIDHPQSPQSSRVLPPTRHDAADGPESPDDRRYEADAGDDDGPADWAEASRMISRAQAEDAAEEADDRPLPAVRQLAETRWGGLLFLVNLFTSLGLPRELGDAFPARPLRWVLHALALELLGLDPRDPAALAFAGLQPDRDPPSKGEPIATDEESAALAAFAGLIAIALHERVAPAASRASGDSATDAATPGASAREAAATLRGVCRREATVAADPGWIELRLRLDEVTLEVRRAGLDLDPGWVPWLGAVVRFVYE